MYNWKLSRINQGYQMTRVNWKDNSIECRELNWFERIIYYFFLESKKG